MLVFIWQHHQGGRRGCGSLTSHLMKLWQGIIDVIACIIHMHFNEYWQKHHCKTSYEVEDKTYAYDCQYISYLGIINCVFFLWLPNSMMFLNNPLCYYHLNDCYLIASSLLQSVIFWIWWHWQHTSNVDTACLPAQQSRVARQGAQLRQNTDYTLITYHVLSMLRSTST